MKTIVILSVLENEVSRFNYIKSIYCKKISLSSQIKKHAKQNPKKLNKNLGRKL